MIHFILISFSDGTVHQKLQMTLLRTRGVKSTSGECERPWCRVRRLLRRLLRHLLRRLLRRLR